MIPKTFVGIVGFMLIVGFLVNGIMSGKDETSQIEQNLNDMRDSMNTTLNNSESSGGFTGTFTMIGSILSFGWNTILLGVNSISSFLAIPAQEGLPNEVIIIFILIIIAFFVATIKIIWSGE